MEVPVLLQPKVLRWCGAADAAWEVLRRVEEQHVVTVHNRWTFATANFNVLRACRPIAGPMGGNGICGPDKLVAASQGPENCDFCAVETMTCLEPFGRVRGKHSCTAGNVFKSAGLHSLVVWKDHAPHKLSREEMHDGLETADAWFSQAIAWDSQRQGATYPVMFWNCFRSAGASQIHPHMQLQLFKSPVAQGALWADQSKRYQSDMKAHRPHDQFDLCKDIVTAHSNLGLAVRVHEPGPVCFASLTPGVVGGELCVLGASSAASSGQPPLAALSSSIYAMMGALSRSGAEGISTVAFLVPSGDEFAWFVRCINRGPATAVVVDASSAELAGLAGVSSDPFQLIEVLRDELFI